MRRMDPDQSRTGTVAGFAVRSEVALRYLRRGASDTPLDVVLGPEEPAPTPDRPPLRVWEPQPDNPFHAKLWRDGPHAHVWIEGVGSYRIDTDRARIEVPRSEGSVSREERLWGIPTSLCVTARGDQTIHAASVEIDGRAVVFGAPGRHGKTTLAAAMHAAGHRLLSEDTTCFRSDAAPVAIPGPALLRLRRDSFQRLGARDATIVGEDPDRVHLSIDGPRRGTGDPVPIAAVALLRSGEQTRVERVEPGLAIPELWALAFKLPTDEDRARCFGAVTELAGSVPVWNLHRPLTWEALDEAVDALRKLASA